MRLILFCLLLMPQMLSAQGNTLRPPLTLKLAPINLLNPAQQALDLRADFPLARRWALEAGTGYIFASAAFAGFKGESYLGFKLRPTLKFYITQTASRDFYVGLTTRYHGIFYQHEVNTLRQGGLYSEWLTERRKLAVWGAALGIGSQRYFGRNKRWVIEYYLALGWRQMRVGEGDLPADADILFTEASGFFWQSSSPGLYHTPDMMLGFCIGRRLRG